MNKNLNIKNKINDYIENWDFDGAYSLYMENKSTRELQKDLVNFLHDTGNIESLYEIVLNDGYTNNHDAYELLEWNGETLTKEQLLNELRFHLEHDKNVLYEKMLSAYYVNPNFLLRQFVSANALESITTFNIFNKYIGYTQNHVLKNFFLKQTIKYFCNTNYEKQTNFFLGNGEIEQFLWILMLSHENYLGNHEYYSLALERLYKVLLGQSSKTLINSLPKIEYKPPKQYKKIAICLYGILRGDYMATLQDIIDNLAKPLNADVFLFTWDQYQIWPGLCGWSEWVERMVDAKAIDIHKIPDEIHYIVNFNKLFKNTYSKLETQYMVKLDINRLEQFKQENNNFKKYTLQNQAQSNYIGKDIGGGFNLYYGIHNVVEVMKEYERENGVTYDFMFTMRSDGDIDFINANPNQALQSIHTMANNEVCDTLYVGAANITIYGPRDVMCALSNLYMILGELPKHIFNLSVNHTVTFLYLTMCGVKNNKNSLIFQKYAQGNKCQQGLYFPNIEQELKDDLAYIKKMALLNDIKIESCTKAINVIKNQFICNKEHTGVEKIKNPSVVAKLERFNDIPWMIEITNKENKMFVAPKDFLFILKLLKFLGKVFPNKKIRHKIRNFTRLFKFTYKKVYGIHLD